MGLVVRAPGPISRVTSQLCQGDPGQVCVGMRDSFMGCAQVVQVCFRGGGDLGVHWGGGDPCGCCCCVE